MQQQGFRGVIGAGNAALVEEKSLIAFSGYVPDGRRDNPHLSIHSMLVFKSRPE